jgi:hypothetical protein
MLDFRFSKRKFIKDAAIAQLFVLPSRTPRIHRHNKVTHRKLASYNPGEFLFRATPFRRRTGNTMPEAQDPETGRVRAPVVAGSDLFDSFEKRGAEETRVLCSTVLAAGRAAAGGSA